MWNVNINDFWEYISKINLFKNYFLYPKMWVLAELEWEHLYNFYYTSLSVILPELQDVSFCFSS